VQHVSPDERTVRALLVASRALVGVAARSLVDVDVTLPQFRALVLLSRSDLTVSGLGEALDVHATTASRLVDRLVGKNLVLRQRSPDDRRVSILRLSAGGRRLVARVTERRMRDLAAIVDRLPQGTPAAVVEALEAFAEASGEPDDLDLFGWNTDPG